MSQHRSVAKKRAVILGIAVTLFFFGKIACDIQSDYRLAITTAEQRAKGLSSALNEHALGTFNDAEGNIDSMIRSIGAATASGMPEEIKLQQVFAAHQRPGSVLATLFVASPQGRLYGISSEFPVRPVQVADREYFQHHQNFRDPALFISKPFRNRLDNNWLITVTKRLSNPDGTLRMIVGAAIKTSYFSNFYSTLEMGHNDRILLIRRDGIILSLEPFNEKTLRQNLLTPDRSRPERRNFPGAGTYQIKNTSDGTDRIIAYRSSPAYPVIAVISLDKREHLAQWRARATKTVVAAGLFLALVASLALLIRKQMASLKEANQHLSNKQRELRESEGRYRRISDAVTDYIYTVHIGEGLHIDTWHGAGCLAVTGYTEQELAADQNLWLDMVAHQDQEAVRRHAADLLTCGDAVAIEHRIIRKDGQLRWVRNMPVPRRDASGRLTEYEGLIQDITEQRAAEEALRLSEQRFRELLENIHLVSMILDTNGRVTFCNDYLLQLTGWSREEVIGADWFDRFLPPEVRAEVRSMFKAGVARGAIEAHYENPIVTKGGDYRFISWDNSLLHHSDDSLAGVASIGRDLTQHRALEEQLRQSQKMEATGLLAGGIAHDFNNILTVIIGYCSIMQMRMSPDDLNRAGVDQVLAAAERAAGLTRSLLAFSRKQVMNPNQVDLNAIVRHVEHFLCRVIGEDITLQADLDSEALYVLADSGQIEQIMMNLATNARDAMPDGGTLSITTRATDLVPALAGSGCCTPGRYALLTVSDNGTGMDEKTRAKIFEPFFTTKEVGKGTGLGLAMAYGTVMQHNGQILVESEPGVGTTFKVYLPLVAYQEPAPRQEVSPFEPHTGHELILVAEDEPAVRELVEGILTRFGYRVLLASDGEDAVAKFTQNRDEIELVLLDMIMPKLSGKAAYDEIARLKPGVRAIFTSGYTADVIRSKGELAPGTEFIMKPVHPLLLLRKVREMLDR